MLGAIRGDGEAQGVPLFRALARRWTSFAPRKHERVALSAMMPAEERPEPKRQWISKPRHPYAHDEMKQTTRTRTWNPWLWIKK